MNKYRIDYWELSPLGWRGCSDLDETFPTEALAVARVHELLFDAMRDRVIAFAAIVRVSDGEVVWQGRNNTAVDMEAMVN